jgi:hypothetical protein
MSILVYILITRAACTKFFTLGSPRGSTVFVLASPSMPFPSGSGLSPLLRHVARDTSRASYCPQSGSFPQYQHGFPASLGGASRSWTHLGRKTFAIAPDASGTGEWRGTKEYTKCIRGIRGMTCWLSSNFDTCNSFAQLCALTLYSAAHCSERRKSRDHRGNRFAEARLLWTNFKAMAQLQDLVSSHTGISMRL